MKTINKIIFFFFSCFALVNLETNCFFNNNSNALSGAAIGGLAGGRKGAAIGLGVGLGADMISNASANSRRRYDDDRYYDKRYKDDYYYYRDNPEEYRPRYRNLQRENEELRRQLEEYQN